MTENKCTNTCNNNTPHNYNIYINRAGGRGLFNPLIFSEPFTFLPWCVSCLRQSRSNMPWSVSVGGVGGNTEPITLRTTLCTSSPPALLTFVLCLCAEAVVPFATVLWLVIGDRRAFTAQAPVPAAPATMSPRSRLFFDSVTPLPPSPSPPHTPSQTFLPPTTITHSTSEFFFARPACGLTNDGFTLATGIAATISVLGTVPLALPLTSPVPATLPLSLAPTALTFSARFKNGFFGLAFTIASVSGVAYMSFSLSLLMLLEAAMMGTRSWSVSALKIPLQQKLIVETKESISASVAKLRVPKRDSS